MEVIVQYTIRMRGSIDKNYEELYDLAKLYGYKQNITDELLSAMIRYTHRKWKEGKIKLHVVKNIRQSKDIPNIIMFTEVD